MSARVTKITMLVDTAQGQASVAELNASLTGNEKAFQANAASASASLTQVERLLTQKAQLARATAANNAALKEENAALTDMQQRAQTSASMQRQLSAEIARTEQIILGLLVTQRELAISTAQTNVAMKGLTPSVKDLTPAVDSATSAWSRQTSMINTGQGPLRGYDALVQAIARSMGGIPVAAAVAIPVVLALAQAFFKSSEAKIESIKLDQDMIRSNLEVQRVMNTGTLFTKDYARTLHDTAASNVVLKGTYEKLMIAQAEEADAIAKEPRGLKMAAEATDDLKTKIVLWTVALFTGTKKQVEATDARLEAQKSLDKEVDARVRAWAETMKTVDALKAELGAIIQDKDALNDLVIAIDAGAAAQARFRAGQGLISGARIKVAGAAAEAGETLTHAEAQRRLTAELARQGGETVKLGKVTELTEKNLKAFNETHRSGAGAARAYANELVNLTKKAEEAEAALLGDSFARREAAIQADTKAQREHLVINKRDREAANDAIDRQESARLQKLSNDRVEAEQRVMVEIAKINIEGNENLIGRKKQSLALETALRVAALIKEFGDTTATQDLILAYKQAKDAEYMRWFLDLTTKNVEARKDAEFRMFDEVDAERARRDKKILDEAVKLAKNRAGAEQAVGGQIGGTLVSPASSSQVAGLMKQIQQLGPAFLEAGKDANVVKRAFDEVGKLFGFVSRDAHTLGLQLKALEQFGRGDVFGALRTSVKALGSELINSGRLAEGFTQILSDSFAQSIGNSQNFIATIGANLVGGMTQIVGQMLLQYGLQLVASGIKDILIGNALNANPFTFGAGFPMIAAGHAEIVQGVIFGAAGGAIAGAGQFAASKINPQNSGAGSGSTSTGAGSGAAGSVTARDRAIQPTLVDVATSPKSSYDSWVDRVFGDNRRRSNQEAINRRNALQADSGPITIELLMGPGEATNFLKGVMDGKGVIRLDNLGQNKQRIKHVLGVK